MNSKRPIIIIIVLFFLFLAVASWFYYLYNPKINYLIPGVPYNGIQNLFFKRANSSVIASVLDILGYWGDERFDVENLKEKFPDTLMFPTSSVSSLTIKNFFENNGYVTYLWTSPGSGREIEEIKKFVNPEKKIPVIVFQKRSFNPDSQAAGPRVVIGIFDKDKKVIIHDNALGNNYEISYQDFENMFTNNSRAVLAVWPSEELKKNIKGPNYSMSYPSRTENMEKVVSLLMKFTEDSVYRDRPEESAKLNIFYKEIVDDPNFKYFPRPFQVSILTTFAGINFSSYIKRYDEAINIINNRVLPLNKNLSEPYEGWYIPPIDQFSRPYYILAVAYFKIGQKELAIENYKKALELRSKFKDEIEEAGFTNLPIIPELEKEISKKK